ncbi:MAG: pyridoxal kinase PdxY, partial [Spirochaetaceae bacterium]|nr:pyridoxal kinase PdxY [Spirochaetaceae bacterium]
MAILSIQSHVVFGAVGNSAAVFPLQRMGHEVWPINTVEFSNHTGYGVWRGQMLEASLVDSLVQGLEERNVLPRCQAVLSGYLGSVQIGHAVGNAVRMARIANPRALYCCDPVMGDVGRGVYVNPDIPSIFSDTLIRRADIITPNQFELELLTGLDTKNVKNLREAFSMLHKKGPRVILVTSYREKTAQDAAPETLDMIVSDAGGQWRVSTPEIHFNGVVSGTGDLCSAIFLSHYLEN